MLHRLLAMLIVGFWIAMTSLLVIRELYPDATSLNTIPVGYVGRLMFQHQQPSDLDIYDREREVGYVHIEPGWSGDKRLRTLKTHGDTTLNLPGAMHRLSWVGSIDMDSEFNVSRVHMSISAGAQAQKVEIDYDSATKITKYLLKTDGVARDQNEFTLDEKGIGDVLETMGLGPEFLAQFNTRRSAMPPPVFEAAQSSVKLNGETVSAYLISMKISGQTLWEAHVSHLGQVLKARAPIFGYVLVPDGVKP